MVVTLIQPLESFQGLTPNQTSVATNIDTFLMGDFAHNAENIQNTAGAIDFFNTILAGLTTAGNSTFLGPCAGRVIAAAV
ncbi:MAG: hypothetical protein WDO13_07080 [Verrucomicrobiota bacterium]